MGKQLSAETIYVGLYVLPRGELRSELLAALRQARKARRPRARGTDRRGQIPNMTPIAERPPEVATRTVPGHWEGDLIKGARNGSAVGTLVERTTRLVILARMTGTDARSAREGFTKKLRHVPALLRKTLTYDRGKEMAEHERLAERFPEIAVDVLHTPLPAGPLFGDPLEGAAVEVEVLVGEPGRQDDGVGVQQVPAQIPLEVVE